MRASTSWTHSYIEIYDTSSGNWYAVQCSTYANALMSIECPHYYDPVANKPVTLGYIQQQATLYSAYYHSASTRKLQAALACQGGYIHFDDLGDIEYYFTHPTDPDAEKVLIVSH